jgi:hypothetical protein
MVEMKRGKRNNGANNTEDGNCNDEETVNDDEKEHVTDYGVNGELVQELKKHEVWKFSLPGARIGPVREHEAVPR